MCGRTPGIDRRQRLDRHGRLQGFGLFAVAFLAAVWRFRRSHFLAVKAFCGNRPAHPPNTSIHKRLLGSHRLQTVEMEGRSLYNDGAKRCCGCLRWSHLSLFMQVFRIGGDGRNLQAGKARRG